MGSPDVGFWADFMSDTVTINAFISRSVSGVPTYNMLVTKSYPAYIEMKNHLVVDRQGREVMARGRVFMGTTEVPGIEDLLTLPAEFTPRTPPMIAVNPVNDESGTHHVTLEIG